MIITMEEIDKPAVSTLEEVKKLQDLVRKLEIQNEQLRNKQSRESRKSTQNISKDNFKTPPSQLSFLPTQKKISAEPIISNYKNCNEIAPILTPEEKQTEGLNYLDGIDLIPFSEVDESDDDSWLYTSPKGLTPEQKLESPYQWLRKDVDDLDNRELQLAKKALIKKLNELEILSPTSQRNQQYTSRAFTGLRKPYVPCKQLSTTDELSPNSFFDTRTFTKSKKKQALEYLASTMCIERSHETRTESSLCRRGSDISLDSLSSVYTDANDVHEAARIQEESLRMSSPIGTPKRHSAASNHSSRRMSISSRSSMSDVDNTEQLPNSHPANETCHRPIAMTPPSSSREVLNHSDHSSPSASPYGSSASLDSVSNDKDDKYRRSLPNLNRGITKPSTNHTSIERKQFTFSARTTSSARRSESNLHIAASEPQRETISPIRQKLKQPTGVRSPPTSNTISRGINRVKNPTPPTPTRTEYVSRLPAKSGLPKPSRNIPSSKPSSGIPVSSVPNRKNMGEDSWSEGCY